VPHILNLRVARPRTGEKANKTRASLRFPKIVTIAESSLCRHGAKMRSFRLLMGSGSTEHLADGARADRRLGLPGAGRAHYSRRMADEPENLTLKLLREMRGEMREGFEKAFGDLAELRGSVSELQIALAATRTDIGVIKADVEDIKETARLIEGRLVRLEKHAGLLKA
jgi:hypothetical protein